MPYPELRAAIGANVPDLRGRVLQEQDTTHVVGTTIDAGLPNIKGEINRGNDDGVATPLACQGSNSTFRNCVGTGPFRIGKSRTSSVWYRQPGSVGIEGFSFDASLANAVYGNSDTVQPPAYMVRFLIRALP